MWFDVALAALNCRVVLELRYDGYIRWVEVHAVGVSRRGRPIMQCWQVRSENVDDDAVGWKLLRLDDAYRARIIAEKSAIVRPGYRRRLRAMVAIVAHV